MRPLHRKLLRDVWQSRGTLAIVVMIIAIGTSSLVGLGSAHRILGLSQAEYYRQCHFADFWINVKKAPLTEVERIARMPEILEVQGRVVFDVLVDLPEQNQPITGRLLSTPVRNADRALNGIHLVSGSGFSDDRDEEVIISDTFAEAHDLQLGDRIHIILNRRREAFVIVGTAISPEYVYMVRGPGDLVPDKEHFGVFYIKQDYARDVLGFRDAFNELTGRVTAGSEDQLDTLLEKIDRSLSPYGVLETVPRERQASHRFLSDEIAGLWATATVMPLIFLAVAALVLNIIMIRLAQRQRTTIGTLKAMGYSNRQILGHYLSFGVVIGILGGLIGCGLGLLMALGMIEMYKLFFQFPHFVFRVYPDLLGIGILVSVVFAVFGTVRGVLEVLRLAPAEAMRPKPPERGGRIFLERFPLLWKCFDFHTQMALRNVFRNRIRTLTGVISTALSISLIFMSLVLYDSFLYMIDYQFEQVAHSDVDVGLREEKSIAALWEIRQLPGVDYAEPILGLRCDMAHGRHHRRVSITGLASGHRLTTPMQSGGKPIEIPSQGIVLSKKLAELLDAHIGDTLEVTPVRGYRVTKRVPVASIVESFLGMDCYADQKYLSGVVGEAYAVNSVQLSVNPAQMQEFFKAVKRRPNIQGVSVREDAKENIQKTVIDTSGFSIGIMVCLAGAIAFGSTLNNSLVEIGDRMSEISTLRVLGYRPYQVAGLLMRQTIATFLVGLILAFPLGYAMVHGLASAYDSELYRIPVIIRPMVAVNTIVLSVLFVAIAELIVYRQITKLDWLEGVKVKE